METLSKLAVNPFDAVAGLMESVLPSTPNATTAASTPNATFTEDTLRMIVHNLYTGDSRCGGRVCLLPCLPMSNLLVTHDSQSALPLPR